MLNSKHFNFRRLANSHLKIKFNLLWFYLFLNENQSSLKGRMKVSIHNLTRVKFSFNLTIVKFK